MESSGFVMPACISFATQNRLLELEPSELKKEIQRNQQVL
jgi:hypothetical protein